jgi:hypothetical protein
MRRSADSPSKRGSATPSPSPAQSGTRIQSTTTTTIVKRKVITGRNTTPTSEKGRRDAAGSPPRHPDYVEVKARRSPVETSSAQLLASSRSARVEAATALARRDRILYQGLGAKEGSAQSASPRRGASPPSGRTKTQPALDSSSAELIAAAEHKDRLLLRVEEGLAFNVIASRKPSLTVAARSPAPAVDNSRLTPKRYAEMHPRTSPPRAVSPYSQSRTLGMDQVSPAPSLVRNGTPRRNQSSSFQDPLRPLATRQTISIPWKLFIALNASLLESTYRYQLLEIESSHQLLLLNTSRALHRALAADYAQLSSNFKLLKLHTEELERRVKYLEKEKATGEQKSSSEATVLHSGPSESPKPQSENLSTISNIGSLSSGGQGPPVRGRQGTVAEASPTPGTPPKNPPPRPQHTVVVHGRATGVVSAR